MLTGKQREAIRAIVVEEIADLEETLASLKERTQPIAPDASLGRLSRLDAMMHKGTAEHLQADASRRLAHLRDKLHTIDLPDFGKCAVCQQPISFERLKAAPESVICIDCARRRNP